MNNRMHPDTWMHRIMIALGLIVILSAVGAVIMVAVLHQPIPELLIASGIAAAVGLVRILLPTLLIG
jgi:hypothetical protein